MLSHACFHLTWPPRTNSHRPRPSIESELFQELCHTMHIHKTRTTPYHPQSDGLVERSNRTVQNILKAYVNTDQTDWDRYLPTTMLASNTSTHSTTGYTPHYLLCGFEVFMPLHIMYPHPQPHQPQPLTHFVSDVHNRLQTATVLPSLPFVRELDSHTHKLLHGTTNRLEQNRSHYTISYGYRPILLHMSHPNCSNTGPDNGKLSTLDHQSPVSSQLSFPQHHIFNAS